jgi:acetyltransferase-like isoleucine patch superfamily enzyme
MKDTFPVVALGRLVVRLKLTPLVTGSRVRLGDGVHVEGRVWLPGPGRVQIGRGVRLVGRRAAIELNAHAGAEIVIDDDVVIEDGTSIEATRSVRIGPRTRIGSFCRITDDHFHNERERFAGSSVPVAIGGDAVVGHHALVLPGAQMGGGARLGPSAVLSFPLPARTQYSDARNAFALGQVDTSVDRPPHLP